VVSDARVEIKVRLPKDLHERAKREADARDLSINLLITRAIELGLDRLVPIAEALP
jgi:predicted HicB family RNase H-like nuclease